MAESHPWIGWRGSERQQVRLDPEAELGRMMAAAEWPRDGLPTWRDLMAVERAERAAAAIDRLRRQSAADDRLLAFRDRAAAIARAAAARAAAPPRTLPAPGVSGGEDVPVSWLSRP